MDPALPFREKDESQGMRQAITISVVGGVLLLAAALADGGGPIEASTKFLLAWGKGNWDDLATVAPEEITVRIGSEEKKGTLTIQAKDGKPVITKVSVE